LGPGLRATVPHQRDGDPGPGLERDPLARDVDPRGTPSMPEVTLDTETIGYIQLFEARTGARVKDCLAAEDKLVYLVYPGEVHKAVGPGGVLVDRLKGMLKKEIQVVEYADDPETLVKNVFYWYGPKQVDLVPKGKGRHATVTVDPAWKARAIGKAGKNLKVARAILLRHTDVGSVSVA